MLYFRLRKGVGGSKRPPYLMTKLPLLATMQCNIIEIVTKLWRNQCHIHFLYDAVDINITSPIGPLAEVSLSCKLKYSLKVRV